MKKIFLILAAAVVLSSVAWAKPYGEKSRAEREGGETVSKNLRFSLFHFFLYNFLTGGLVMEEGVKLSNAVERYALGGFLRLRGGVLKLYEDKIALSRLAGSMEIPLSELERYAKRD